MKKALIFQGGWDGHTPLETSLEYKKMLEPHGFEVTIVDNLEYLNDYENLLQFDLIVPMWTMGEISGQQRDNVSRAVQSGIGLAGCHGGMCDSFRMDTEWQFMTGSQWVAHPGNDGTPYMVNLVPGNEFTEGLEDFKVESEQYYIHVDPCVKVYATTTFPVADGPHASNGEVKVPVVYTKMWGKGRVFYNSLGHHDDVFDNSPNAAVLMERGMVWAAGGKEFNEKHGLTVDRYLNNAKMY